jgi:hypothetical protein
LFDLTPNPLSTFAERGLFCIVKPELELESDGAEHAQGVVVEGGGGVDGRAESARLEVGEGRAEGVDEFAGVNVEKQSVDGEIAAESVIEEGSGRHFWFARFGIVRFFAGGHELDVGAFDLNHGGAESGIDLGVGMDQLGESEGV